MTATLLDRDVTLDEVLHLLTEELGPDYIVRRTGSDSALTVRKRHGVRDATIEALQTRRGTAFVVHGHRSVARTVREALDECLTRAAPGD
jgi:hypothetical protein